MDTIRRRVNDGEGMYVFCVEFESGVTFPPARLAPIPRKKHGNLFYYRKFALAVGIFFYLIFF